MPSHYQWWLIVSCTIGDTLKSKYNTFLGLNDLSFPKVLLVLNLTCIALVEYHSVKTCECILQIGEQNEYPISNYHFACLIDSIQFSFLNAYTPGWASFIEYCRPNISFAISLTNSTPNISRCMVPIPALIMNRARERERGNLVNNTLRPRQIGHPFADDVFKYIFLNENIWISLMISLKFVPNVPINNIPALVQIMAWRRSGDKPLSEPIMVSILTHVCVTRPQWDKWRMRLIFSIFITPFILFEHRNEGFNVKKEICDRVFVFAPWWRQDSLTLIALMARC